MGFRDIGSVPNRREVEAKLNGMGDYVKMDYLQRLLKQNIDFDTKKFVLVKLAQIYEPRGMFADAGKLMIVSAEINTTFDGKMNDFMKGAEMFVKAGRYDESDIAFQKALACANTSQKVELKIKRKEMIKGHAKDLMKKDKRNNAMQAYEKLLSIELSDPEKREVQNILLGLYEKLGRSEISIV